MKTELVQTLIAQWPEQHLEENGARFTYREAGKNKKNSLSIVFLHGIGSGSASWLYQFSALSDQARVIAWDAPGYGGSAPLTMDSPKAKDYAKALAIFLNGLHLKQVYLVGHSLGALIGASFAVHFQERVLKLLLVDPAIGYGEATPDERDKKLNQRLNMMETLGPIGLANQRSSNLLTSAATIESKALVFWNMAKLNPAGHKQAVKLLSQGTLLSDIKQLELPIEVIWGAEDRITLPDDCRKVAAAAKTQGQEIPLAGHTSYIENSKFFNQYLMSFIERADGK